ncbi:MAG: insulinase family protein [Muribaculaceae bacterium]|nr:insulinase family protein [Muribaculaceae bacterium]
MKTRLLLFLSALLLGSLALSAVSVPFDTVPGDPLKTRIYTLPNGLQVMMSVNKDTPRVQTFIGVRVGGKNDPAETTGLAHYFEHLMFKGTPNFGTSDFEAERPLLDSIESAFETYRMTSDPDARAKIYARIDSLSYAASLIAIPNEYDKLMSAIGAQGSNAFTSMDMTCYTEDIPSNQIENWARVQSDRFRQPILRGFHTELETIYEEKNMSMKSDSEKAIDSLLSVVFPRHPYGTQTVLGTQEHLKNPSITNVKRYHSQWYVPNNMVIAMAGDFNPDEAIEIIDRYFGSMEPNPSLPSPVLAPDNAISATTEKEVLGPENETVYVAWQLPGAWSDESTTIETMGTVMQNGWCGLLDTNVHLPQLTLSSGCFAYQMADGGCFILYGQPKAGQTLEQVRDILLNQADSLRNGLFSEEIVRAAAANNKLALAKSIESNENRAYMMVNSFMNRRPWQKEVASFTALDTLSKASITDLARKYLGQDNYAVVYKRTGTDPSVSEIAKPKLTPIATNRDKTSTFLTEITSSRVEPIEPRFVDFERDLTILEAKAATPVYYVRNTTNDIFSLEFIYETGTGALPLLNDASSLIELASTPTMTAADIQRRFYELACTYSIGAGRERSAISLSGLSENMEAALTLLEDFISNATVDNATFETWISDLEQKRINYKTNEAWNFYALTTYQTYGPDNMLTSRLSPEALRELGPDKILASLRELLGFRHRTVYYGPASEKSLLAILDAHTPDNPAEAPYSAPYTVVATDEPVIYLANYDMAQADYQRLSRLPELYSLELEPERKMYNTYFGGGMNAVVFQEMRESRSLAYSAYANNYHQQRAGRPYLFTAYIATQVDKLPEAMAAFDDIIDNMPESEQAFAVAKQSVENDLRTSRTIKDKIADAYIAHLDRGDAVEAQSYIYAHLPELTLDTVRDYQRAHIRGLGHSIAILGPLDKIDIEALRKKARVVVLSQEEIFGY